MKRRAMIVGAVLAAHLLLFAIVAKWKVLPKKRHVPPANFGAAEATYTEPDTGNKVTVKEFTVTTKLTPSPTTSPVASPAPTTASDPGPPPRSADPAGAIPEPPAP